MQKQELIPSVNFHLWEPCNMRCKFCFAGFKDVKNTILPKGHLSKEDALRVIEHLGEFGLSKISFAGGEPTLCPWLAELIERAKSYSMSTMLITNGTNITNEYLTSLKGFLDWVVISIDSVVPETNIAAGRKVNSAGILTEEDYRAKVNTIKSLGFRLKVNTVVHRNNFSEILNGFIEDIQPERWKIMRVLGVEGQNDKWIDQMSISESEFVYYRERNQIIKSGIEVVIENNDDMRGSYLMIDPAGRFFDNVAGRHSYSQPITEVGVKKALSQISYSLDKFVHRGGLYNW